MYNRHKIAIIGSTGSIGTQTLDIIAENPELFQVELLSANSNWELLARQALLFKPSYVIIGEAGYYERLKEALSGSGIDVFCGKEALAELPAKCEAQTIVTATTGYSGFIPTIKAIKASKRIALANKETLVVGGSLIMPLAKEYDAEIIPVDSEHSAIFQCIVGEDHKKLRRIFLTASGGPFRNWSKDQLKDATLKDALNHPNWSMGSKVTIDSASMMNKGFEMIEAKWLFNTEPENIEIVVHPQSIVHSMVEFCDGSVKAQLGLPDMHTPIRYALGYPERIKTGSSSFMNIKDFANLTFEKPDLEKFPMLELAFTAISKGGNIPCVLNAANEIAVDAFLHQKIRFIDIPRLVLKVMDSANYIQNPSINDLIETNEESLNEAKSVLNSLI